MAIKLCILIGGILSLVMVLLHSRFYKMFKWEDEFAKISLANSRIIYTIHVALILMFLIFGILSLVFVNELSQCRGLSFGLLLCYSLFWLWRAIWQMVYFKPPKDYKGKVPAIGYIMTLLFILLFVVYLLPLVLKYGFGF